MASQKLEKAFSFRSGKKGYPGQQKSKFCGKESFFVPNFGQIIINDLDALVQGK